MAALSSPSTSNITKDALFLFELFRESPTPIVIQIGPYANKTGSKPNTIIKRLAGIKKRNNLNINTTLGEYQRPATDAVKSATDVKLEATVKKERAIKSDLHGASMKYEVNDKVSFSAGVSPGSVPSSSATAASSPMTPVTPVPRLSMSSAGSMPSSGVMTPRSWTTTIPQEFPSLKRRVQYIIDDDEEAEDGQGLEWMGSGTAWKKVRV